MRSSMNLKTSQKGFTLIELVLVIVILGILAVTAAPKFIDLTGDWSAQGYRCTSTNSGTQRIGIVHILETGSVIATKIIGDPCVKAGEETFSGSYDGMASSFNVLFKLRPPGSSGPQPPPGRWTGTGREPGPPCPSRGW